MQKRKQARDVAGMTATYILHIQRVGSGYGSRKTENYNYIIGLNKIILPCQIEQ